LVPNRFPHLGVLPDEIAFQTYENIDHFTAKSTYYNGCLALGATSVDNGKGGGWEKIRGNHAVKLNGRTHHFLPHTGGTGGLEYFTFDAEAALCQYGNSLNRDNRHGDNIDDSILRKIFKELKEVNPLIRDCEIIGRISSSLQDEVDEDDINDQETCQNLISVINQRTSHFDIAAITSISRTGNRILIYQLKDCPRASKIPMYHSLLEPLSYPIFFPWGYGGWGSEWKRIHFSTYLLCRLLMPDFIYNENWTGTNSSEPRYKPQYLLNQCGTKEIPVNRFQCQARLGQMYFTGLSVIFDEFLILL
jgi:hypothetical protein